MARATSDRVKPRGRAAAGRPAAGAKLRAEARGAAKSPPTTAGASKEELRARIEKLERANATLRIKNKELRLAAVEAAEQVDALTVQLASSERRAHRGARLDAAGETAGAKESARASHARRKAAAAPAEGEDEVEVDAGQPEDSRHGWSASGHADA